MTPKGYPVQYDGGMLYMGPLTADVKKAFADWVKPRALASAMKTMPTAEYLQYRAGVIGVDDDDDEDKDAPGSSIYWTATPSMEVAQALKTKSGQIYLNRLLFGEGVKKWSNADLWTFLKSKDTKAPTPEDRQPVQSDYVIAFNLVWEEQDPKAPRPSGGTEGQAGTTGSCPTSPPSTPSASPEATPAA